MEDGSRALGLFNLSPSADTVAITWTQLGLKGPQRIRDFWRQQDIGIRDEGFSAEVPPHGAVMIRIWPAGRQ
jgi:alpha-galactosidase